MQELLGKGRVISTRGIQLLNTIFNVKCVIHGHTTCIFCQRLDLLTGLLRTPPPSPLVGGGREYCERETGVA